MLKLHMYKLALERKTTKMCRALHNISFWLPFLGASHRIGEINEHGDKSQGSALWVGVYLGLPLYIGQKYPYQLVST